MEALIANKTSRRASSISGPLIQILQEHSERILKLEAMVKVCVSSPDPFSVLLPQQHQRVEHVMNSDPSENRGTPEPSLTQRVELVVNSDEQSFIGIEQQTAAPRDEEKNKVTFDVTELNEKIALKVSEASAINAEIHDLEDGLEDSADDSVSICTEDCQGMIKEVPVDELTRMGSWNVDIERCGSCTKQQLKAYQKAKKEAEKLRKKQQKEIKEAQKALLKEELKALQLRLKNVKKGRDEEYGLDKSLTKQERMKEELRKIAANKDSGKSEFKIQMFM